MASKLEWSKLERFTVYISFSAYTVAKTMTTLMPSAKTFLPDEAQVLILNVAILSTVVYLVKQLDKLGLRTQQAQVHPSFNEAFNAWLNERNEIEDLILCVYTSHTFRESLWSRKTKMARVRLLLFHESTGHPNASGTPDTTITDLQTNLGHWRQMVQDGRIGQLQIKRRATNASFFFGIADGKAMIEGLLWPRQGMGGLEPIQTSTLSSETAAMRERIGTYSDWFEKMWDVSETL